MREMLAQINKRLDTLSTKEDVRDIHREIHKNAEDIEEIRREMKTNNEELRTEIKANSDSLPEAIQTEVYKVLRSRPDDEQAGDHIRHHQSFLLCRRSVRMWPVKDTGGGLKAAAKIFMKEFLSMDDHRINRIVIEAVSPTQQLPRSKIKDEILVNFDTSDDRDMVYAHAKHLADHAGKAGIRLEIPPHLKHEFKLLEGHGNMIRTMYGSAVKRSIRFDDSECSLILNMKLSPSDPWVTVSVDQARETKKMRGQASVALIRQSYPDHQHQALSSSQGRALGLPAQPSANRTPIGGKRPRPLGTPPDTANNPFSYLNGGTGGK